MNLAHQGIPPGIIAAVRPQFDAIDERKVLAAIITLLDTLPDTGLLDLRIERGSDDRRNAVQLFLIPSPEASTRAEALYELRWNDELGGVSLVLQNCNVTRQSVIAYV